MQLIDDGELEWMAELDWRQHGLLGRGYASDHRFIADAIRLFAEQIIEPWPDGVDHFLARAGDMPRGAWRPATLAFTAGGTRTSVYRDTVDLVRKNASIFAVPIVDTDNVTPAEWQAVEDAAEPHWSTGEGARRVWWRIAPIFAELAREKRILTYIAEKGGGPEAPLRPETWRIDPVTAVRRLAKCGLNLDRPFDADAPVTHMLFVERIAPELKLAARENFVTPLDLDERLHREIDEQDMPFALMRRHLATLLTAENLHLTNEDFIAALEERFNVHLSGRKFQEMKKQLLKGMEGEVAERFRTAGRRRKH